MIWSRKTKLHYGRRLSLLVCLLMMAGLVVSFFPQPARAASVDDLADTLNSLYSNVRLGWDTLNQVYSNANSSLSLYDPSNPDASPWATVFASGTGLDVTTLAQNWYGGDEDAAKRDVSYLLRDFARLIYYGGTGAEYDTTVLNDFWDANDQIIRNIVGSDVSEADFCSYMNATIAYMPNAVVALSDSGTLDDIRSGKENLNNPTIDQLMNDCMAYALNNTARNHYPQFNKNSDGADWDFGSIINNGYIWVDQAIDPGSWGEIYLMIAIPPYNPGGGGGGGRLVVETTGGSAGSSATATLNGKVVSNGTGSPITEYGFYYSTGQISDANPGTKVVAGSGDQPAPFDFTAGLSDLTPDTTYYFRAYAVASGITYYGDVGAFKTQQPPPVQPPGFSDVPDDYWAKDPIRQLAGEGIVAGYPDGTFRPDQQITRAEFTRIITLALKMADIEPAKPTYDDVAPEAWYYGFIESGTRAGIVKGYGDGTFRPNNLISREEVCCVLEQALGKEAEAYANANATTVFRDDSTIAWWSRGFVALAYRDGLISGYPDGTFAPHRNTTRAEVCAMVAKLLALKNAAE